MRALRTPDERFADLEGWPYEPQYVEVGDGLRMHYIDEGPSSGSAVLLAHGEPTWGYLYRKMIPPLLAAGRRVVVPDLIGFGRSDKPAARNDYTYMNHVEWTGAFLEAVNLRDVVLFGQDWGGVIFLVHVGRQPERFRAVVAANTALPEPDISIDAVPSEVVTPFLSWLQWSQEREELLPSEVVGGDSPLNQTGYRLGPGEAAAYDAPYPDESYRAGARQFPLIVPLNDADPPATMLRAAWDGLERFERPFVTAFADHENITASSNHSFGSASPVRTASRTRPSATRATSCRSTIPSSWSISSWSSTPRSWRRGPIGCPTSHPSRRRAPSPPGRVHQRAVRSRGRSFGVRRPRRRHGGNAFRLGRRRFDVRRAQNQCAAPSVFT